MSTVFAKIQHNANYLLTARSTKWVQESIDAMHVTLLQAVIPRTRIVSFPEKAQRRCLSRRNTHNRRGRPRTLTTHEPLRSPFLGRNSHSLFFFSFSFFPSMEALFFFSSQETLVNCFFFILLFSAFQLFAFLTKHDEKNTLSTTYMSSVSLVFSS